MPCGRLFDFSAYKVGDFIEKFDVFAGTEQFVVKFRVFVDRHAEFRENSPRKVGKVGYRYVFEACFDRGKQFVFRFFHDLPYAVIIIVKSFARNARFFCNVFYGDAVKFLFGDQRRKRRFYRSFRLYRAFVYFFIACSHFILLVRVVRLHYTIHM